MRDAAAEASATGSWVPYAPEGLEGGRSAGKSLRRGPVQGSQGDSNHCSNCFRPESLLPGFSALSREEKKQHPRAQWLTLGTPQT